ncbi:MAG: DUF1588 domain-containing protein [Armatimonadaceae bacterium]
MRKATQQKLVSSVLIAVPVALVVVSGFAPVRAGNTRLQTVEPKVYPAEEKAQPPKAGEQATFDGQIAPLLGKYCTPCHNNMSAAGGYNFAQKQEIAAITKDQVRWRKVAQQIQQRSMPPKGTPQPTDAERDQVVQWLTATLDAASATLAPTDPGRVVIHRLNRQEYNNTVRDLLGITSNPADKFPADGGGGGGFDNNADTLYLPPILMERYLDAADQIMSEVKPERLFVVRPKTFAEAPKTAKTILEHFAFRAYRRPVEAAEMQTLMRLYHTAVKNGGNWEAGVKLAMKAVLVSPNFLFRVERPQPTDAAYPLNDFEIASRLSYFLWASMPDDQLLRLALQKKLGDPRTLEQQVRRMRESPKFREFVRSFTGQWLRVRELYTSAQPDGNKFREYTPSLRNAMFQETVLFTESILRRDASLLELVDADYTYLNEELAKHYGIGGVTHKDMRQVRLSDRRRGGLLTMGSVLTLSSYPLRTSPVLRGKWILSEFLGTPPPPPPPVVATLSQDDTPSKEGLTFRQRLEKHREKPECASCHARIDPLGFGLENYDPIGRWRDKIAEVAVDASAELPDGSKFAGPMELKQVILGRKEEFLRNLTEKMLAYALGRGLQENDLPTVRRIIEAVKKDDYRSTTLLLEVVRSYPFQYRKNG